MIIEQYNNLTLSEKMILLSDFIKQNSDFDFDLILSISGLEKVFLYCEEINLSLEKISDSFRDDYSKHEKELHSILNYHII